MIEKLLNQNPEASGKNLVTFINLYSYGILRRQPKWLQAMDVVHLDGFLMVWILNTLGHKFKRQSFDMGSIAEEVLAQAERDGQSVYFLGGETGIAQRASAILRICYPTLKVRGASPGYFHDAIERSAKIAEIIRQAPDIIIVGMGAGFQEQMLIDLRAAGFNGTGYTCGGFLHQTAGGRVRYYPVWINRLGLRWLFRCVREPKVLRRVLVNYPVNSLRLIWDYWMWHRSMRRT